MARLAQRADSQVAADVLARAFAHDPLLSYLLGPRARSEDALRRFFRIEVSLAHGGRGEVWLDDDLLGAAVWRRPAAWPEAAGVPLRTVVSYLRVFSRRFPVANRAATTLARAHPAEPHWYLQFVGVAPEAAGHGRGRSLLEPVLSRCDRDGRAAYLEATSDDSARLFVRLGFEPLEEISLEGDLVVRPMWRTPG